MYLHAGTQVIDIGFTPTIESQQVITANNLSYFAQKVIPTLETQILVLNCELQRTKNTIDAHEKTISELKEQIALLFELIDINK